jgi:hypothetical protein
MVVHPGNLDSKITVAVSFGTAGTLVRDGQQGFPFSKLHEASAKHYAAIIRSPRLENYDHANTGNI